MEDGKRLETESGTVQGGLISPVLANVYLHYTLGTWFDYVKKYEFKGEMYMVRYADDFVFLFQYENEARKFYQLLIERLKKFGLEIAGYYPLADTREQKKALIFWVLRITMRKAIGGNMYTAQNK